MNPAQKFVDHDSFKNMVDKKSSYFQWPKYRLI